MTELDTVELRRFREEWKAEVKTRKRASDATAPTSNSSHTQSSSPTSPAVLVATQKYLNLKPVSAPADAVPTGKVHVNTTVLSQNLRSALQLYREAIQREQNGELDDALALYRQAFRMEPHVDRAYSREEKLAAALAPTLTKEAGAAQIDTLSRNFTSSMSLDKGKQVVVAGILAQIVSTFPPDIQFELKDDKRPLRLRSLPNELIVSILKRLDVTSIERFALVCRKARLLSLDATLWRELTTLTYKPPQITQADSLSTLMDRYVYNYRRMFIEHPRVRLDGVYIAICHYVRPGLSENHWVNLSHLITYHRYLRFFPNGSVLSLLANEEMSPKQVISLLRPTLRMKGLHLGTWQLLGNTVHLNLLDANERPPKSLPTSFSPLLSMLEHLEVPEAPHPHRQHTPHNHASFPNQTQTRYVFIMRLELTSRPLGRWNRLSIQSYDSVHLETGDMAPFVLKHERPFWFSKVRSYS